MKYCLIGEKLGHSYSKEIHSLLGLDYSLVEVKRDEIARFLKSGYCGFNVTIPYKKEIVPFLDGLSDDAKEIGAVNTVAVKDGKLYGFNTDIFGMEYAMQLADITLTGKTVMILGSGGTSLTAKALCKKLGAKKVVTVSRSGKVNYFNCYDEKDIEVIINTTPVGMYPNDGGCPIDVFAFPCLESVFDCIYNPLRTKLILNAQKLGIKNTGGLSMLVAQALKSAEIWTEKPFDSNTFNFVFKKIMQEKRNIVLIGMPSCGKTTVANALCSVTGRETVDTDGLIFRSEGRSPSEIIETCGEEVFRDKESRAIEKACEKTGVIISTGGGAVLRKDNVELLKKNGYLIYLERSVEKLSDIDRPLSKNGAISRLFEQRRPIYESVCDKKISNDGRLEDTVEEILKI